MRSGFFLRILDDRMMRYVFPSQDLGLRHRRFHEAEQGGEIETVAPFTAIEPKITTRRSTSGWTTKTSIVTSSVRLKKTWGEFKTWCKQEMIPSCWKEQERRKPFQNAFSAQHGLVLCLDICWWKFAYFLGVLGALSEDGGNSCRCGTEINTCTKSPSRCGVFGNI